MMSIPVEILLVEDSLPDAELTMTVLRANHLLNKIAHVRDGVEALDFLFGKGAFLGRDLSEGPHLILLDLRLPRIDGIAVLRAKEDDERTKAIPVLILISSPHERHLVETQRVRVAGYLPKPVRFHMLQDAVRSIDFQWLLMHEHLEGGEIPDKTIVLPPLPR